MFSFKKIPLIIFMILFVFSGSKILAYFGFFKHRILNFANIQKTVFIQDNGFNFPTKTDARTVTEWLAENKINLQEHDQIIPAKETVIFPGTYIQIKRALPIKIEADGKSLKIWTLQNNIGHIISENKIFLSPLDKVSPDINFPPEENLNIIVTRINVEEKIIPEEIDFKIIHKEDPKLGWREEKIEQKGEKGIREVKYEITYKNGREISRVPLEKNITKEPVPQIATKGTYMKLGKDARGQGTWYAFKGGLFAASTSIPRGSYAKVTNLANGKTVVVQINDYGPQGKGRIIDLDKVAFQKIAALGAGVIGVKVEEVLN